MVCLNKKFKSLYNQKSRRMAPLPFSCFFGLFGFFRSSPTSTNTSDHVDHHQINGLISSSKISQRHDQPFPAEFLETSVILITNFESCLPIHAKSNCSLHITERDRLQNEIGQRCPRFPFEKCGTCIFSESADSSGKSQHERLLDAEYP